jgi:hypothetical protein
MHVRALAVAVFLAGVAFAGQARAGGIGVLDMTGFHAGVDPADIEGAGTWFDQGGGIELWVGSRASRISGRVRVLYNNVSPAENYAQHFALATFGLEVQLLKNLEAPFGVHVHFDLGPAFLALQHEEFGMADLGVGIHGDLSEHVTLFAEVSGQMRFRRYVWGGAVFTGGVRFPID